VCAEYNHEIEGRGYVDQSPSNQAGEVTAAIKACEIAKKHGLVDISIVTDSKYLYNAATKWIDQLRVNEWRDHWGKSVVNRKIFEQLIEAQRGLNIRWAHVKGHSDSFGNLKADTLARGLLSAQVERLCALSASARELQPASVELEELKRKVRACEAPHLIELNGKIYFLDTKLPEGSQHRLHVPETSQGWLMNLAHDDPTYGGHLGATKTHRKLLRFWWPKMYKEVQNYVRSCGTCQRFKNPVELPPGYLHPITVSEVFEHVHMDVIGPLKTTHKGNNYIITATDAFSKWAFASACPNAKTEELIDFLDKKVLSVHGCPKVVITDRGARFTSTKWKD